MVNKGRKALLGFCCAFVFLAGGSRAAAWDADEIVGSTDVQFAPLGEDTAWWESIPFGNFTADAVLAQTGADAVLLENRDILGSLPSDDILYSDITAAYREEAALAQTLLTKDQLKALLEQAVAAVTVDAQQESVASGREELADCLQVAGLTFTYDPTAPVGERIVSLVLDNEKDTLLVTASEAIFASAAMQGIDEVSQSLADCVASYIQSADFSEADYSASRVNAIGVTDGSIVRNFPRWVVIVAPLLAAALVVYVRLSLRRLHPFSRITEQRKQRNRQ